MTWRKSGEAPYHASLDIARDGRVVTTIRVTAENGRITVRDLPEGLEPFEATWLALRLPEAAGWEA
jgi:hypothetical protein